MKLKKLLPFIILLVASQLIYCQPAKVNWDKWNYLIGEWVGEGNGKPGQGEGSFSFQPGLDGKILVRKNHTVFPETANAAAKVHDDLLIIYSEDNGENQDAIYFDNEGNTIKYKVIYRDNSIILTSGKSANSPVFRLSYIKIDDKTCNITFEMASPDSPETFKTYLSGKAFKVN